MAKADAQLAKLNARIEQEQAKFIAAVSSAVVETLAGYGLTLLDLLSTDAPYKSPKAATKKAATKSAKPKATVTKLRKRKPAFKGPQPMKYADPETGAQWSGFGRAPTWIAGVEDRSPYLIDKAA